MESRKPTTKESLELERFDSDVLCGELYRRERVAEAAKHREVLAKAQARLTKLRDDPLGAEYRELQCILQWLAVAERAEAGDR